MQFQPVNSSNVQEVGYDEPTQELQVRFKNNSLYRYIGVPKVEFDNLLGAESVGKYLNANIKPVYQVEKIG